MVVSDNLLYGRPVQSNITSVQFSGKQSVILQLIREGMSVPAHIRIAQ